MDPHVRLELRPYQVEALDRIAEHEQRGVRRQLGVAATGLGKTVIFSSLAERRGGRALLLAHRDELVTQAAAKTLEVWPDLGATDATLAALRSSGGYQRLLDTIERNPNGVGIVKGSANDVRAHVVVGSVQTLGRTKRLAQLTQAFDPDALFSVPCEPFGLVVVDEAHHARADTYTRVLGALRAGADGCECGEPHERPATPDEVDAGCELGVAYDPCPMVPPGPLLLGVTATPDRGDGKGLDRVFDQVSFAYDMLWGIAEGYLSDLRGLSVMLEKFQLGQVKVSRGDYNVGQAGSLMMAAGAPALIARAWHEHAADRKTLVFTPTVAMAQAVAAEFVGMGVPAGWVSGEVDIDTRRNTLQAFSEGRLQVLANCAVLTEGYDEPSVDCVVVARPTRSRALYAQMIGRGTRRHPDKTDCLVLDVVGATAEHSLITIPSLLGLPEKHARGLRDGSVTALGAATDHQEAEVAAGRLRAEEVALFSQVRADGIAWVKVKDTLSRYHRPLGKDKPTVVMRQTATDDRWVAGLIMPDGTKRVLLADVSLTMAQGVAEDYVRKHGSEHLVALDAPWRARKPTPKQLDAAQKWRLPVDPKWTAGELSEALDAHIAQARLRQDRRAGRR